MKSPFPGMDPFLEDKAEWSSVHTWLIAELASELGNVVTPHFFVRIEQRVYITVPDRPGDKGVIVPDMFIMSDPKSPADSTATMANAIMTPTLVEPATDLEIHDRYIEIRDVRNREVVTTIELLSPFNKAPGHQGYDAFQRKRRQVMASPVHWIELICYGRENGRWNCSDAAIIMRYSNEAALPARLKCGHLIYATGCRSSACRYATLFPMCRSICRRRLTKFTRAPIMPIV